MYNIISHLQYAFEFNVIYKSLCSHQSKREQKYTCIIFTLSLSYII